MVVGIIGKMDDCQINRTEYLDYHSWVKSYWNKRNYHTFFSHRHTYYN